MNLPPPPPVSLVEVAVGVVRRAGCVLVTRRKTGQIMAGWWEFPGGKLEPGETAAVAVVRELREEIGLDVHPVVTLPTLRHDYPHAQVRLNVFLVEAPVGQPQALEVADCRWVGRAELGQLDMLPGNRALVDHLLDHWTELVSVQVG